MPLLTTVIILWISLVSSQDSSEWFVADVDDWKAEEKSDFLAEEKLLPVTSRQNVKVIQPTNFHPRKTTQHETADVKKAEHAQKRTAREKMVTQDTKHELESEELLLKNKVDNVVVNVRPSTEKNEDDVERKSFREKTNTEDLQENEDAAHVDCDTEKDVDCLLKSEELIPIKTKLSAKNTKPIPVKPKPNANLANSDKRIHSLNVPNQDKKKMENVLEKQDTRNNDNLRPVVARHLLEKTGDAEFETYERITENTEFKEEEDAVPENGDNSDRGMRDRVIEHIGDFDDLVFTIHGDADNFENEFGFHRVRREAGDDADVGSGVGTPSPYSPSATNEDLKYKIKLSLMLQTPYNGTVLPESVQKEYIRLFQEKLEKAFENVTGFHKLEVKKVYLDKNYDNRIRADYDLWLSLMGATNYEERLQNLIKSMVTIGIPNVNNITVKKDPVYSAGKLDPNLFNGTLQGILTNPCEAENPCPDGYNNCTMTTPMFGECQHKCVSSGLVNKCENGGECQLDKSFQPFCQCGKSYTGVFCEKKTDSRKGLTTPEIVGVSLGAVLVAAALTSCCVYLVFCRRTSDKNMDYTYFGDESQPLDGFSNQSSALGIRPVYIDRPFISPAPLDIFSFNRSHDSSQDA